jgi:asparagine synthetase B (glutamine-hydrolysing)
MTELKDLLIKNIKNEVNNEKNVAIFFSAGTDSLTCLFSCLELKLNPHLYCFRLENHISEDSIMAEKISTLFNIPLKIIIIKEDIDQVSKDVCNLIKKYNISNKIRIQILYPFPHMLKEIKEDVILTGLSADTLYGTNYHSKIHLLKDFSKSRKEAIVYDEIDGYNILKDLVESFGKKLIAPYRNEEVINYFLRYSWIELNEPIQKQHSVEAFKNYFNQSSIYRKSSSLTINAKIWDLHNNLLKSSLNELHRESIEELYSDILHKRING